MAIQEQVVDDDKQVLRCLNAKFWKESNWRLRSR
jgi:hypothetical protein